MLSLAVQVYMHPHQMAHSLRDADISEMVDRGQLKLIYIDSSPELSTSCSKAARDYLTDSSISVDEEVGWHSFYVGRVQAHRTSCDAGLSCDGHVGPSAQRNSIETLADEAGAVSVAGPSR